MILVIGESGSGKSHSLRNLNHEETFIFSTHKDKLPFKGARKKYTIKSDSNPKGNVIVTQDFSFIKKGLKAINDESKYDHISNVVIDDFQNLMINDLVTKSSRKDWDKWNELVKEVWELIKLASYMRPDLNIIILSHATKNDDGFMRMKTVGKMLDDKIYVEGLFDVVALASYDKNYKFVLRGKGTSTAKFPDDMKKEYQLPDEIDNDVSLLLKSLEAYSNDLEEDIKQ